MQKLWRQDNVDKEQLSLARFYNNISYERVIYII